MISKQLSFLESNGVLPRFPILASEVAKIDLEFPLKKEPYQISATWYWAIERYKKYELDTFLTEKVFKTMCIKYAIQIGQIFEGNWREHKKYIDWYLSSSDEFIKNIVKYNFNFLASTSCVNKYLEGVPETKSIIENTEDRMNYGKWIE